MSGKPKVVRDLMTRAPLTLERNDRLSLADEVMEQCRVRHMPVVDEDGQLAGIVSQRDLFRGALATALGYGTVGQKRVLDALAIKEAMCTEVQTADPGMSLEEAAKKMLVHKIGCLPVVERGQLIGIITESDFLTAFATYGAP